MNIINKSIQIITEEGIKSFLSKSRAFISNKIREKFGEIYSQHVRQYLPKTGSYQKYNGIKVIPKRLGDTLFSSFSDNPEYEKEFVKRIRKYVKQGNSVIVIGGYYGVSTVAAANQVGTDGSVTTYEATNKGAEQVRQTAAINDVKDRVRVIASSVGSIHFLKFRKGSDNSVPPEDLPDCDVLAIDCDGCELDVLGNLTISPQFIIIEHHGVSPGEDGLEFEYQRQKVERILDGQGYNLINVTTQERQTGGFENRIGWFVAEKV